jgi:iron-sulfur cluster repair protein YtfE (RIC family)
MGYAITKMQPLRDEHKELWPHVEKLLSIAGTVGQSDPAAIRRDLEEAFEFLNGHLIPHAVAEDCVLYPTVQRIMGATEATATMSRDHVEVARFLTDLNLVRRSLSQLAA